MKTTKGYTVMQDSGERQKFETGAVRDIATGKPRPDLISPHANLREGAWLALGAEKYAVDNWAKGIPIRRCIASLCRHLEAYKLGLKDEDHMAAIRTNAGFILHYEEEIKAGRLPASLDDMPHYAGRLPVVQPTAGQALNTARDFFFFPPPEGDQRINPVTGQRERYVRFTEADRAHAGMVMENIPGDTVNGHMIRDVKKGEETVVDPEELRKLGKRSVCPHCLAPLGGPHWGNCTRGLDGPQGWVSPRKPFTVYLCGPITGQHEDTRWRAHANTFCFDRRIKILDPMRGKAPDKIGNQGMSYMGQLAAPEIASRDADDIKEADVIFAHFPYEPPRQSIGSLMEMGMASALGKTILLCTKVKVFSEHLFCRNFCTLEPDFDQALRRIEAMAKAKQR